MNNKNNLLILIEVYPGIMYVNSIKNLRYSTRFDNSNWRFGKRQDLLAQARFFMWKQPINPAHQLQSSVKAPIIPFNFNRYGIAPPAAAMAPILQNYMFTMPTKVNYPLYQQSMQDINEKRKPGNLHHITIINAIMPKPYLPTPPTYAHPTTTFRNYRTNNKFLHQQYLSNFARQNMELFNNVNAQHKLQQQQQLQKHQMVYPLNTYALNINKPTVDLTNPLSYNTVSNNSSMESYGVNSMKSESVSACGRKNKDDSNNSASEIMYYYCNNRITNYKNPTQYQIVATQTTTTAPTATSTTSTTTERPSTTTARIAHTSFDYYTTAKPIFLPTPNEPLETNNVAVASLPNTVTNAESEGNFKYREDYSSKRYEDMRPDSPVQYQPRKTLTRYDDLRRKQQQQQYTTAAVYDNMKLHSFFTIEDAVTKAPEMQVFNDPYQAYRHARRHHHSHQRQTTTPTTTTTTTTKTPKYRSFFDDLEDEDYTTSEAHHYEYSFFGNPQKSTYRKPVYRSEQKYSQPNQIIDQTYKTIDDNTYFTESYEGKPKIKEHHFDLFRSIRPTAYTAPPITTYKPFDNIKGNTLTTHKSPHNFVSYRSRSMPTTTTELIMSNRKETETTTDLYPLQFRTSTITPVTTTTERKMNKLKLKSPLTLKTPTTYKYPKHRSIKKPYKTLTSTTTTKATPTLKKMPKYQRQFKVKKLKQFKHLFTTSTTSSTTTTTTTTTAMPSTTVENYTKKASSRIFPITSTTEESTTRKIPSRTITTTDSTKSRKSTGRKQISATETANTNKKKVTRVESKPTSANTSTRKQVSRRGSKRANKTMTEKEVSSTRTTARRSESKSRRRHTPTSIAPKPDVKRSTSSITLTTSSTTPPTRTTTSTSTTTSTTMRSIMRIANSKSRSRSQAQNQFKSSIKTYNDVESTTFNNRGVFKSITSTGASVPPLPIEIYFQRSQNAKI